MIAISNWGEVFPNAACVVSLVERLVHNTDILLLPRAFSADNRASPIFLLKARVTHCLMHRGTQIAARPARCPKALGSLLPFRPIVLRGGRQFSRTPGRCWSRVPSSAPRHGRQSRDHSNRLGNGHTSARDATGGNVSLARHRTGRPPTATVSAPSGPCSVRPCRCSPHRTATLRR